MTWSTKDHSYQLYLFVGGDELQFWEVGSVAGGITGHERHAFGGGVRADVKIGEW